MAPKTMNEEFEYVSSSSGATINASQLDQELSDQPFNQQPIHQQAINYEPTHDQPIDEQQSGSPILKLSTRDKLLKYLVNASAYLNGKTFNETAKLAMMRDNELLLLDLAGLPTKDNDLIADEPITVLDITWTFVVTIMNSLNVNLTTLLDYYDSLTIGEETRKQLLNDNHWLINAMLDTPTTILAARKPKTKSHKPSKLFEHRRLDDHYLFHMTIKEILIIVSLLALLVAVLFHWFDATNKRNAELETKLAFQDEQMAYLRERLEKSKTCLDVDTLLEKSKDFIHYDALKEKSKLLFDSLGEKSKDVYDMDKLRDFTTKGKRYLDELFANYWR